MNTNIGLGERPSPRVAHSAAAVGSNIFVHGGIGPNGLASGDLYVLKLNATFAPQWRCVSVRGSGPGRRYAHVMAFVAQRFLVVHGGKNADGRLLGDSWYIDTTSEQPYEWIRMDPAGETPQARTYAAAATRADGLILICGGLGADGIPLADAFGLVRHRDGRWEWLPAPGEAPVARYQHATAFVGNRLHIIGGNVGVGTLVDDARSLAVLDSRPPSEWTVTSGSVSSGGDNSQIAAAAAACRCQHTAAGIGSLVFVYGGLRGRNLLGDMYVSENPRPSEAGMTHEERMTALGEVIDLQAPAWQRWLSDADAGLVDEANESHGRQRCCICMENPRKVRFDCGHLTMCETCVAELVNSPNQGSRCPVCRAEITCFLELETNASANSSARTYVPPPPFNTNWQERFVRAIERLRCIVRSPEPHYGLPGA